MEKTVYDVRLVGIRPMLTTTTRGVDDLDPLKQRYDDAVKVYRKSKTLESAEELSRLEWELALPVLDGKVGIPAETIERVIRDGAAAQKKGKDVQAGVEVEQPFIPLIHDGPKDWKKLYDTTDAQGRRTHVLRVAVKLKGMNAACVMRSRPRFPNWELRFRLVRYGFAGVGEAGILKALETAGMAKGIGGWRPKYGLFRVDEFKKIS